MTAIPDPRREKEIFEQALDLTSEPERQRFLQEACGKDPVLLARVGGLFAAFDRARSFLAEETHAGPPGAEEREEPGPAPGAPPAEAVVQTVTEKAGDRLGRYKLLEKIGEGGCGVVYMAEQLEPVRRRVALKIVKLGMDTKQVIARFEAERQALAVMEHPHIARVFDAGTTDTGRPYFVMELVRGVRITQFCDERRLPLRERLGLFIQVCHAIQHAHQKGIIHRDIKPSNVLVTLNDGVPVPKVIDFGIAKATAGSLTDQTLFTRFEQFLGTPAYMSPEQAEVRGVDIDTRSDIYSLGVVLYEMLTGRTPFDCKALLQRGIEELILTLREVEPPRPSRCLSTLSPADLHTVAQSQHADAPKLIYSLRGDLDWIVMKCLEKDRARRYDTANGLAMDIRRYLGNEPIVARPPSAAYRLQKAVRRHKLGFAATGLVALALAGGVGSVVFVEHRANQEFRQRFYAYQMGRAGAAVAAGQFEHLQAALAQCPEDYRHWEWSYLNSQVDRWSRRTVFKLDQPLRRLLVSGGGDLVALMAGKENGTIQIHQFPSGERLSTIEMVTSMWTPQALHPDGGMLAGTPNDDRQTVQVWDTRTGRLLKSFQHPDPIQCLAFSPDGRRLAAGGGGSTVSCWELATGAVCLPPIPISYATALAFAPDARELAVGTRGGAIHFVDLATGGSLAQFSVGEDPVQLVAYSPNGKQLVSNQVKNSLQRNSAKLWNRADGSSRDLGATAGGNTQFSPDGRQILSGSTTLWDSASGEMIGRLRLDDLNYGMATCFHPRAGILSAGEGGAVVLAQPNRPAAERLLGHRASLRVLRFSPDGRRIASAGLERVIRLWDVGTAQAWTNYTGHSAGVAALAWSPDGRSVVSSSFPGELHCWEPASMRLRWTNSLETIQARGAWWLEFSPDGKRILSSSENATLGLWDSLTGASLGRVAPTNLSGVMDGAAWSPDGKHIAGLFKNRIVLWKVDGWEEQWSVPVDADRCVRFSRDGRWLVHGNYDGSVTLRDAGDGRVLRSFDRHPTAVKGVVLSRDGRRLFSGGADGTVRIWDTFTGDELLQLNVTGNRLVWSIDLSPDGLTLGAADSDGVITLWKTEAPAQP